MHCRHCGTEISEKAQFCPSCGVHPLTDHLFCQECGAETNEKQAICISCGVRLVNTTSYVLPATPPKSAGTATFLSCIVPGVGQLYLGQSIKAVVVFLVFSALGGISGGFLALPLWLASMVDTHRIGSKLAKGIPVGQWEFF